jgi:hypothetical protein
MRHRVWSLLLLGEFALCTQCSRRNRVGEHVWVVYEGTPVRAFIVEKTGEARMRVQFEGCDSTWQREMTTDRISGRLSDAESLRPPLHPACAPTSAARKGDAVGLAVPYRVGDRIRVKWRRSSYNATIVGLLPPDRMQVHYEGLENAWDEVISTDRIEGAR